MKMKMIAWIISCIIAFVFGFYFRSLTLNTKSNSKVIVKQLQGDKIYHSNFNYKNRYIEFTTTSEGKGKIQTQIPKENIPEANAWLYKNNGIQVGLIYLYDNKIIRSYFLSYIYRFDTLSFGTGLIFGDTFGLNVFVQYWFSAR